MRKVFKKAIFVFVVSVIVFGAIPLSELACLDLPEFGNMQKLTASVSEFFGGLSVKAETPEYTSGYYTYTVDENGNATITGVDTSISGNITIPSTLDGYPVTIIGDDSFYNCTKLTGIEIPDSVTSIETDAFQNCKNLENATIPNKVVNLGGGAFYNCSKLTNITIPENVTSIGNGAFYGCKGLVTVNFKATNCETMGSKDFPVFNGCTALETVIIENNVETIPEYAFSGCDFTSISIPKSVKTICNGAFYLCDELTSVVVSNGVTSIGNEAFYKCTELVSVIIPDSVKHLGDRAFYQCTKITNIDLSNNLTNIGQSAFSRCASLADITIPNSVTSIGETAFSACTKLSSVTIPDYIVSIGESAFYGCTSLEIVNYNAINCSTMGSGSPSYRTVFENCSSITTLNIGDNVETIPAYAFYHINSLEIVNMGNNLTTINEYAFWNCKGLTSLTIPDSVTSIGNYAFWNCEGLTSLTIGNSVMFIGGGAFSDCIKLTNITIPENVTSIGNGAFNGCKGLVTVNFKATNCETMGSYSSTVFENCSSITTLNIGDSVETIPAYAFCSNNSLEIVNIGNNLTTIKEYAFGGCRGLTSLTIPDSVTSIGNYAFWNCEGLVSVTIGCGVTSIGRDAFRNCYGIMSVTYNAINCSIMGLNLSAGQVSSLFYDSSSFTTLNIGDSVETIPAYAFYHNNSLKIVNMGNNLTSIGDYAFCYCGFTSIKIPDSVTSIGDGAFNNCTSLSDITIGNSVTSIGDYAFCYCGFTSITIPDSVTSIGDGAFGGMGLEFVKIGNGVPNLNGFAFSGIYSENSNLTEVIIGNGVTNIDNSAFYYCTGLTSITIGNSVTSIGDRAFYNCKALTSITIPDSVTSIGDSAFYGCTSLTSITIPGSVTSIGDGAFLSCSGLTSVTIDYGVTSIGKEAFRYCEGITSVTIPDSVLSIGGSAFAIRNKYGSTYYDAPCKGVTYYSGPEYFWDAISGSSSCGISKANIIYNCKINKSDKLTLYKDIYTCFEGESVFVSGDMYAADGISNVTLHWSSGDGVEVLAPASIINSDVNNASFSVEVKGLSAGMHSVTVYTSSGKSDSCIIKVIKPESELIVSVGGAGRYYFVDGELLDGKLNEIDEIPFKVTVENRLKEGGVSEMTEELKEKLMIKDVKVSSVLSDYSGLLIDIEDMNKLQNIGDLQVGDKKEFVLRVYPNNFMLPEEEITLNTIVSASEQSDISIVTPIEIRDKLYEPQAIVSFNVFNQNIIYNEKEYDSEAIEVSVRITNRIPSSFSGNTAKLREISDCDITVSEIEISAKDSKLLSDAGIRTKELNTVLHAGESTVITGTYHINTKHKMDEKVESETVGFSCNVSTSANSPKATKSVTFVNKDCKIEQIKNENINKAAEKAADALANLKKGHKGEAQITLDPRLSNVFTKSEIEQIQDYILTQILLQSLSDESMTDEIVDKFLEYVDEKVDEENNIDEELKEDLKAFFGSFNPDVSVYNKDIDMDIVIETKNHGTITMNIKTSVMKTDLDDSNVASSGHLTYTIEGNNLPQGITSTEFISPLAIVDVTNFMEAAEELVIEEIAALYSEIWGNDLDKVVDIVCGKIVNDILAHTEYKSAKGLVFAAMVNPVKRFCAKCPVDIFIYDSEGKLCAAVENDVISKTSEKALVSVNGSEKTVLLLDETYSVIFKPTGNDATMDITIEEFANSSSLLRTINFNDVPLEFGEHYSQTITSETLADKSNYALTHDTSGEKIQADSVKKILHYHTIGEYETVSDAKCNQASIIRGKCTICFDTVLCSTDIFGECKAGEWIVEAEATLTSEGKKVKSCLYCGEILEEEIIPKLSEDNPNDTPTNPSEPVTPPAGEETNVAVVVRNPSTTTISYGDEIILHADVTGTLPAGATIKWEASNGNFAMEVSADGTTCKISPSSKGDTTFTVSVVDANGNVVSSDEQFMTSKAGFFQKIIAFFKKLFGLTKTIPQIYNSIF